MKQEILNLLRFAWKFAAFVLVLLFITGRLGGVMDYFMAVKVKQSGNYFSRPFGVKNDTYKDKTGKLPESAYIGEEFYDIYR